PRPSSAPCYSALRALHSFPTRRSSDLHGPRPLASALLDRAHGGAQGVQRPWLRQRRCATRAHMFLLCSFRIQDEARREGGKEGTDRKSTRLNSSHVKSSYAVFCLKKKK